MLLGHDVDVDMQEETHKAPSRTFKNEQLWASAMNDLYCARDLKV